MPNLIISSDQYPTMGIHVADTTENVIKTHHPPAILKQFYGGNEAVPARNAAITAIEEGGAHGGNIYIPLYIIIEWLKNSNPGKKIILLISNCQVVSTSIEQPEQDLLAGAYAAGNIAGQMLTTEIDTMPELNVKRESWEIINLKRQQQTPPSETSDSFQWGTAIDEEGDPQAGWVTPALARKQEEEAVQAKRRRLLRSDKRIVDIHYLIKVFDKLDTLQKPPAGATGGGASAGAGGASGAGGGASGAGGGASNGGNRGKRKRRKTKRKSRRQIGCGTKQTKRKQTKRKRTKRKRTKRKRRRQ